jgi:hypothetical protein
MNRFTFYRQFFDNPLAEECSELSADQCMTEAKAGRCVYRQGSLGKPSTCAAPSGSLSRRIPNDVAIAELTAAQRNGTPQPLIQKEVETIRLTPLSAKPFRRTSQVYSLPDPMTSPGIYPSVGGPTTVPLLSASDAAAAVRQVAAAQVVPLTYEQFVQGLQSSTAQCMATTSVGAGGGYTEQLRREYAERLANLSGYTIDPSLYSNPRLLCDAMSFLTQRNRAKSEGKEFTSGSDSAAAEIKAWIDRLNAVDAAVRTRQSVARRDQETEAEYGYGVVTDLLKTSGIDGCMSASPSIRKSAADYLSTNSFPLDPEFVTDPNPFNFCSAVKYSDDRANELPSSPTPSYPQSIAGWVQLYRDQVVKAEPRSTDGYDRSSMVRTKKSVIQS